MLTFLSELRVANCNPSNEIVSALGTIFCFTNSNRSVSNLEVKETHVGILYSSLGPHQYSIIPISSTDMTTLNVGLYCKIKKKKAKQINLFKYNFQNFLSFLSINSRLPTLLTSFLNYLILGGINIFILLKYFSLQLNIIIEISKYKFKYLVVFN